MSHISSTDSLLSLLLSLDIPEHQAREALLATNYVSIENALEYMHSHSIESFHIASTQPRQQYKLVLCVRQDLKMRSGKIAAQCVHAALGVYREVEKSVLEEWESFGEPVICLKIESEEELMALEAAAKAENLPNYVVCDAGRTQVAEGSMTVLAIGPADGVKIDKITGHLKLV